MDTAGSNRRREAELAVGADTTPVALAATLLRVLVLDEQGSIAERAVAALREYCFARVDYVRVAGASAFTRALDTEPDIILAAFRQTVFGAADALAVLEQRRSPIPLIVVAELADLPIAEPVATRALAELVTSERLYRLRYCVPLALERRRKDEESRRAHLRYRLTFENVPVGIVTARDSGEMISINAHALRILGREGARSAADFTDAAMAYADPGERRGYLERLRTEGSVRNFETRFRRSNGEIIPVLLTGRAVQDPSGKGLLIVTIIEDLTERRLAESALQLSEQRLSGLFSSAMDGIFMIDELLRIVLVNPAGQRMFGMSREDMLGDSLQDYIPGAVNTILGGRQGGANPGEPVSAAAVGAIGKRRDGMQFPVEVLIATLETPQGRMYTAFIRDVTERVQQEMRIAKLSRFHTVLSAINSAIVRIREREALLQEACRVAVESGGLAVAMTMMISVDGTVLEAVAGAGTGSTGLAHIRHPYQRDPAADDLSRALLQRVTVVDNDLLRNPQSPGNARALSLGFRSVIGLPLIVEDRAVGVLMLASTEPGFFTQEEVRILEEVTADVSFALDSIRKAERVDHLAFYDSLTDLPNRNLFQERIGQALRQPGKAAVVLLDIERFRFVNETLGRQAGDELLRQVGARLGAATQGELSPVLRNIARLSGNSFALLLGSVRDVEHATLAVKHVLRQTFTVPFDIPGSELRVRARCGVAMYPSDGNDVDQLMRNAEAALDNARQSADGLAFYAPVMNAHAADVLSLENKLRRAIEREEFVLHYQPKVSVIDRKVTGVEALLRWQDPETGLVAPARFIPILEETGMIFEVGRWAMQQALRDHADWKARGIFTPQIAVNISPLQLRHRDFLADTRRTLEAFEGDAVGIDFEITESIIMDDLAHNIDILKSVRELGVNVALDDFGTGYSSLSYLGKLPVNVLKIDRSFIIEMTGSPQGFAIVSAIIALAHALNLKVVAEGVETEEQAKILRVLNCDEIQGYLICKPLPRERLEEWFGRVGAVPALQKS